MKTIFKREIQKTTKEKQAKTERSKGNRSYGKPIYPIFIQFVLTSLKQHLTGPDQYCNNSHRLAIIKTDLA